MTIGIYSLKFEGTTYIYIGQSIDIEDRYKRHLSDLRNNRASNKLAAAYFLFGTPALHIIEQCSVDELDKKEVFYIQSFDCLNSGLNTIDKTTPRNYSKQVISKLAKYTEDIYYKVMLECIANPLYSPKKIAEITNTDSITVSNLRNFKSFTWLEYKYPEEYSKLKAIQSTPKKTYLPVIEKKVEYYPDIVSPEGEVFKLAKGEVRSFAKTRGISYTGLNKVLNNKLEHISGWMLSIG